MPDDSSNMDAEFISDKGDIITWENIALAVRHENVHVEQVDEGYLVDGELFRLVSDE